MSAVTGSTGDRRRGRRHVLDQTYERHDAVIIGGSPLRLLRLSSAGRVAATQLERAIAEGEPSPAGPLTARLVDIGAIHPVAEEPARTFGLDDVTVVIPVRRRGREATSQQPAGMTGAPVVPERVIVVDDGSDPPLCWATMRSAQSAGPADARNRGLAVVSTALVAFVDDDVEIDIGDWISPLLGHFDDDEVALVAPRVRSRTGDGLLAGYERDHSPLDLGDRPARIRAGTRVSYVPAAALLCRTDALRGIGGFDTELRAGEDVDLVWRLDEHGWSCRYDPSVVVEHRPRPTWRAWARQRITYGESSAPLARRHRRALAPARLNRWSLAVWCAAVIMPPWAGIGTGLGIAIGSAIALTRRLDDVDPTVSMRLALIGHLRAGGQLATAVRRAWWPPLLIGAVFSRRIRRIMILSILCARHPIVVLDDVSACLGVWRGCLAERTLDPLRIDVVSEQPLRSRIAAHPSSGVDPVPSGA